MSQEKRLKAITEQHASTLDDREKRWRKAAQKVHGNRYDYSKVKYETARKAVTIICSEHGEFQQVPDRHLTSGCRKCANEDTKGLYTEKYFLDFPDRKKRRATLYYVQFTYPGGTFYKVGVTSASISQRFALVKRAKTTYAVLAELRTSLYRAFKMEQEIQSTHGAKFRYRPNIEEALIRRIRIGPSECFSKPLPKNLIKRVFY